MRRRREPVPVCLDDEILELHEDEPELLALADAITATQRRRRPRPRLVAAAVIAALAAAAVVAVAVTETSEAGVVDDAKRALAAGDVLHAVIASTLPRDFVLDVGRGTRTPSRVETLVWFDSGAGRVRVAGRRNGEVVSVADDPDATARFVRAYEDALERGRVGDVSEAKRSFTIDAAGVAGVVELGDDDLPARFVPERGAPIDFADFSVEDELPAIEVVPAPAAQGGSIIAKESVSVEAVAARARFRPLAPPLLAGLRRRQVLVERLASADSGGALVGNGVAVLYGDANRFLALRQSRAPAAAYGFVDGRTFGGNPVPRAPRADLRVEADEALAQLRIGGHYVTVRGSDEELVVAAVRQLVG